MVVLYTIMGLFSLLIATAACLHRKRPLIFCLDNDFVRDASAIIGKVNFQAPWLRINDGIITIPKGYAWDGATPKLSVFGLFIIGALDGALRLGKPATYYVTLVHDALCQYRHQLTVTKAQSVELFDTMLAEADFTPRPLYTWLVRKLGPQDFAVDATATTDSTPTQN